MQLSPPILTNERTDQDAFFLFRLYDPLTNMTFKYVSLFLFITKDGKQLIPPDLYQSDQGIIKLKIQRAPGDTVIYADREPVLNGLYADPGGIIKVKGPILQEGGLYRIHVEIFGIDSYFTIFKQADIPKFDVYLSVGDFYQKPVSENGTSYNMTVISYYDKIKNMTFDQPKKTLTWSMPFNYNLTRIKNESDIYVHEEVRIPRNFTDLAGGFFFTATADGKTLNRENLLLDPFASSSQLIIHLLLNKQYIASLVENSPQRDNTRGNMTFTLHRDDASNSETSTLLYSDRGGLAMPLTWSPSVLSAGNSTTLGIKFLDQSSGNQIDGDVIYNMSVMDRNGHDILERDFLTAKGGSDSQVITFPSNELYHLELTVGKITNSTGPVPDPSRYGRGIGTVVVPEFGSLAPVAMAGAVAGIIALARIASNSKISPPRKK